MAGAEPPSLPRLSPIGWSIDETSDLHSAVFDIADGGGRDERASTIDHLQRSSDVVKQGTVRERTPRSPLREWDEGERTSNKTPPTTTGLVLPEDGVQRSRRASVVGDGSEKGMQAPSKVSRTGSIFRLKRPFGGRKSSSNAITKQAEPEPARGSSSAHFHDLTQTSSKKSNASFDPARASSENEHAYGNRQANGTTDSSDVVWSSDASPNKKDRQTRLAELSEGMGLPKSEAQPRIPILALPEDDDAFIRRPPVKSTSVDSSSTRSASVEGTPSIRRKRDKSHPPLTAAPNAPLPPLPKSFANDDEVEDMIIGRRGDPVDEDEDMLTIPTRSEFATTAQSDTASSVEDTSSSTSLQRIVRKTKSQSSLRLLRTRSILTNLRQPSSSKTLTPSPGSSSSTGPWKSSASSHLDLGDSSPETERISLPHSEEVLRDSTSSPSLEEVRRALSPTFDPKRAVGSRRPSTSQGQSKLDTSGGAGGLFGGGRPRTSSLLPWRQRANSHANPDAALLANSNKPSPSPSRPLQSAESFDGDAEAFVAYIVANVPRTEVPAVLAASGDELHKAALRIFLRKFLFADHPLDVALRKLLMSLCLPKETQQIDRVMEAFARRYNECNEALFVSHDQPYMLAFSLMMLHTDTFNRNAKQKMTKADYVRNTSASGVAPEILEYLYDNLTFTQFIYVEDEGFLQRRKSETESTTSTLRSAFTSASNAAKSRVDPYLIIASGQTHTLRPEVHIDEDSPFSAMGSRSEFDVEGLVSSFVNSPSIEIVTARKATLPNASSALGGYYAALPAVGKEEETIMTLRVTKVGCISRKDDMLEDNKKSQSRKWKTCGMILSTSQLLFFRDLVWTSALDQRIVEQVREQPDKEGGVLITPRITYFKPDGVLALGDAVAVRDTTYSKYNHVFRLLARQGDVQRQYLIQTANEEEMNDWIHKINFCSTFRSSGLRIRGLDVGSAGAAEGNGSTPSTPSNNNSSSPLDSPTSFSASSPGSPSSTNDGGGGIPMVGLLRRKLNARFREFNPVIEKVSVTLDKHQRELDDKLRLARHIMVATPFMKSTRERLEALAVPLALEIRQLRLEVARWSCRRELLVLELEAGNRAAKASAPSTAFDETKFGMTWSPSIRGSSFTLGGTSPAGLTPAEGSRAGSFSISRASSFSQSRAGSIMTAVPDLPPPALPTTSFAAHSESEVTTPTIGSMQLLHGGGGDEFSSSSSPPLPPPPSTTSPGRKSKSRSTERRPSAIAREAEQERWDRTKMGRDADKRISLVTLPDASQQWQSLTAKKLAASPSS